MTAETVAQPIRVFVIEEHPAVRTALQRRLGAMQELRVVGAGHQIPPALTFLRATQPDVILLGLPHQLLQDPRLARATVSRLTQIAPVIVLATYAEEFEQATFLQAGAQRYLLKQIDSGRLIREIELVARQPRTDNSPAANRDWQPALGVA